MRSEVVARIRQTQHNPYSRVLEGQHLSMCSVCWLQNPLESLSLTIEWLGRPFVAGSGVKSTTLANLFSTKFTSGTKKEKRSKKERNGGYYYLPISLHPATGWIL
jgi:hypothetical protein